MDRSCGDDCIDQLVSKAEDLHKVTDVLDRSGKGFVIGHKVLVDDSPEGTKCNQAIRTALEDYKQAKLENLSALALGKWRKHEDTRHRTAK